MIFFKPEEPYGTYGETMDFEMHFPDVEFVFLGETISPVMHTQEVRVSEGKFAAVIDQGKSDCQE